MQTWSCSIHGLRLEERLDGGATAAYEGFSYNHTLKNLDDPRHQSDLSRLDLLRQTNISWNWTKRQPILLSISTARIGAAAGWRSQISSRISSMMSRCRCLLPEGGHSISRLETGPSQDQELYRGCSLQYPALNITAFSHTKVPRLSLLAPAAAAAAGQL